MATTRSKSNGGGGDHEPKPAPLVAIVDDDASVRQSSDRLIRSFGFRTQIFASGREFLSSVASGNAACVLLDMRMPEMDGLEIQRALAERGARTPIVFLTGRASEEEERRARSAGAVAFLRKPVNQASLRQAIDSVVARGDRNGNRDS
jgi:two-component system response regulator FixJ